MNEYNFTTDRWYIYDAEKHGKLAAGLYLASPVEITDWYDDYASYVTRCNELNITPVEDE